MTAIPTYRLKENHGSNDPKLHLKETLEMELGKNDDLIIIATGPNDMYALDI